MNSVIRQSVPEGPGSVSGAPNLPEGFAETFTSRYVETGQVRLHAVIGGDGPPLLLVHGWPETWYAWRHLMPALAELLHETSIRHGAFEAITPPHNWWDWYAAYLHARQDGADPDPAAASADKYMAEVKHVVPKT